MLHRCRCLTQFPIQGISESELRKGFRGVVARPERFELPTPRFEAWCSIQLSYGRRTRSLGSLAAKVKALSALLSAPQHVADTT